MTHDDAHSRTDQRPSSWRTTIVSGMAGYIDSAFIVGSGTAFVIYQDALGLTASEVGLLSGSLTLGIAAGALVGGRLGDRLGRKRVFIGTMIIIIIAAALLAFGASFPVLLAGAVLGGLGTGADLPVALATIAEAARDRDRGKHVSFTQILWTGGIVGASGLGIVVGDLGRLGGQLLFAHVGIVAAVVFVLRLSIPESVQWQLQKAREGNGSRRRGSLRDLLDRRYLVPFVALLVFYPLVNLAANTQGQFNTYVSTNVVGLSVSAASTIAFTLNIIGFAWGYLFMRVVDGGNRMRWFMFGTAIGVAGPLVPVLFGFDIVTLIVAQAAIGFWTAFAFEAMMKVWTQESFPTMLRSTAQGAIVAAARVLAAALATVTPLLLDSSPELMFSILSSVIFAGALAAIIVFWSRRPIGLEERDAELDEVELARG